MVSEITIYFKHIQSPARLLDKPHSPLVLYSSDAGFFLFRSLSTPHTPAFFLQPTAQEELGQEVHQVARDLFEFSPTNDLHYRREGALTKQQRGILLDVIEYLHECRVAQYCTATRGERELLLFGENPRKNLRYIHPGFAPIIEDLFD